jgi:hypothetical protein
MSESNQLEAFAEDLAVFRQLTTSAERLEFTHLMKRAYAQQLSACAFVQRSPERQVSERIRQLCEVALSPATMAAADGTQEKPDAGDKDDMNIAR